MPTFRSHDKLHACLMATIGSEESPENLSTDRIHQSLLLPTAVQGWAK